MANPDLCINAEYKPTCNPSYAAFAGLKLGRTGSLLKSQFHKRPCYRVSTLQLMCCLYSVKCVRSDCYGGYLAVRGPYLVLSRVVGLYL